MGIHIHILLDYNDPWTHTDTKHFNFMDIINHKEINELEAVREITSTRSLALSSRETGNNIETQTKK